MSSLELESRNDDVAETFPTDITVKENPPEFENIWETERGPTMCLRVF